MVVQDADKLLGPAVEATLAALELTDADTALVRLTRKYAAAIDGGDDLDKLGGRLLAALAALGATPAARARRRTGGGGQGGERRLTALRDARRPG